MFGEIAARYDFLNHLLSLNIDKRWRRKTVREVPPVGNAPLLDLCTGTGDLALAYTQQTRAPIVAADFCPQMLSIGKQKAERAGLAQQIEFVEADAEQLPFATDRFQIVAVAFGLRNVSNTDVALEEMARVCAPGGKVAVLEFSSPRTWPLSAMYRFYFRRILPRIGQAIARNGSGAYEYLPNSVGEFPSYEALGERMRTAGLSKVEYTPLTFGVATLYVGTKPLRARQTKDYDAETTESQIAPTTDRQPVLP